MLDVKYLNSHPRKNSLWHLISNQTTQVLPKVLSAVGACFVFASQPTVTDDCYFLEKLEENHYNTYQPQKYQERNWYVGLKKNGKPKLGPRTHIGQKAIFFLPRQLDDSGEWRLLDTSPEWSGSCSRGALVSYIHILGWGQLWRRVVNMLARIKKVMSFYLWCIFIRMRTSCSFIEIFVFILIKMQQSRDTMHFIFSVK